MKEGRGNGGKPGPRERHQYVHLETKREKRERLMGEAEKKIVELQRRVAVSQQAAQAAINLLKPYTAHSKPVGPLRRMFERTGRT